MPSSVALLQAVAQVVWRLLKMAGGKRLGEPPRKAMHRSETARWSGCARLREAGALPLGCVCACVAMTVAVVGSGVGEPPLRDTVSEVL
jgi:hypothetical protein